MTITMYDSISARAIPSGAQAVAGYVGGRWPDYSLIAQRFPKARHKSVAVNALENADILDVENGDASPAEAPAWYRRQKGRGLKLPGFYANESTMPAVVSAVTDAGIKPSEYVLWVAHYDGIASLAVGGFPGAKAKQYIDHGPNGENVDIS